MCLWDWKGEGILHDAGLKVNAAKSFFFMQETEYLGYILTRGGIKPQPKKLQIILALNPPAKNYNNSLVWFNTMGVLRFYSVKNSINLIGTLSCP